MKFNIRGAPLNGLVLTIAFVFIGLLVVRALRGPDKTEGAELHYKVAMAAMGKSDFAVADEELQKALALTPRNPLLLYNLALVQSKAEHPVAAMKSLRKATELGLPPDEREKATDLWAILTHRLKAYSQQLVLRPKEDGLTSIVSSSTGLCVDVPSASEEPGTELIQYPCTDKPNQHFLIDWLGNGKWRIVASHSHLCLDVPNSSLKGGVKLIQYTCTGQPNQLFEVEAVDNMTSRIIAQHSHLCLDLGERGIVIQRDCLDPVLDGPH